MTSCLLKELLSSQRDYISTCWHAATSGVLFCFHKSHGNTNSAKCEMLSILSAAQANVDTQRKKINKANICLEIIIIIKLKCEEKKKACKYFSVQGISQIHMTNFHIHSFLWQAAPRLLPAVWKPTSFSLFWSCLPLAWLALTPSSCTTNQLEA